MPRMRLVFTLVFPALVAGVCLDPWSGAAGKDLGDAGPEVWVSGPPTLDLSGADDFPDVGVDNWGNRIYVWTLYGRGADIALRRFDAAGNPLEDPRKINTTTDLTQDRPRVAVAADGSFLVVWQSSEDDGGTNRRWVRGRAFNANGSAKGPEQLVSNPSSGTAALIDIDVAALRESDGTHGGWVVVWESFITSGNDNSSSNIQMQLMSESGVPTGNPIQVNTVIPGSQRKPTVAELDDGGFIVVWIEPGVQGRRYNAVGAPQGGQFRFDTFGQGINDEPDVAIGWNGMVAAVWENGSEIRARLFDRNLDPQGADFQVNTVTDNLQEEPRLGDLGPFGFLVTWSSINASAGTDTNLSIQARQITGSNQFEGPQVQWNIWETNNQYAPVANGWYGRAGSAWESLGSSDNDTAPFSDHILGRDLDACIFCADGWGGLWRWSKVVGESP